MQKINKKLEETYEDISNFMDYLLRGSMVQQVVAGILITVSTAVAMFCAVLVIIAILKNLFYFLIALSVFVAYTTFTSYKKWKETKDKGQ